MFKALVGLLLISIFALGIQKSRILEAKPCSEIINYAVGSFDRRFGLTQEKFLSALSEAEKSWEKEVGRELFSYAPAGPDLRVNLVYDYRQQATEELNELESAVKADEREYRSLERKYRGLKAQQATLKVQYDSLTLIFQQHNAAYEAQVKAWNDGSRASEVEFQALEASRQALEVEIAQIRQVEGQLNGAVNEINALVEPLNDLAKELNLNVEEYNEIGDSRGETFTGGLYVSDREGERIDIYEFENYNKLVRVLAHELGHALGLDHIKDKNAIMYELNSGERLALTNADVSALKALCLSE